MRDYATEDIVIGVIASVGILILIVVFVLVFRQVLRK
jgi:hypothetical protein